MPYPSPKGQLTMLYVSQFRRIVLNNGKSQSKKLNSKLKTRMSEKYSSKTTNHSHTKCSAVNLLGQNDGNSIIENTFPKDKGIQIDIHMEIMEYGKNCHWNHHMYLSVKGYYYIAEIIKCIDLWNSITGVIEVTTNVYLWNYIASITGVTEIITRIYNYIN